MPFLLENSREKTVLAIEPWEDLGRIEMPGVSEGRQPRFWKELDTQILSLAMQS